MSTSKNILVLYSGNEEPADVTQLAQAITGLGSTAVVRKMGNGVGNGEYDRILDAVAMADTVIYWPPDRKGP